MSHTPCTKKELKEFLSYESKLYGLKSKMYPVFAIREGTIAYKYIYILRHAEYHVNNNHRLRSLLWRVRLLKIQGKTGVKIPVNTCGKGIKLMHIGSILVNSKAHIGENSSFHINTAIVAGGRTNGAPEIGDNVVIGIGAILLGEIKIPNGCAIGANALVNKSFEEENIAIAGVPARKISNNGKFTWNNANKSKR